MTKELFLGALKELRKEEKKGFVQSLDLIVNLAELDLRKENIAVFLSLPNKFKENKICAFLEAKSPLVDRTITKAEITAIEKKNLKKIAKEHEFFISSASLMPSVAGTFGKILGPLGKMPNPKFGGVVMKEDASIIKATVDKFRNALSIKAKEMSLKASIGKEDMTDAQLAENADAAYNAILNALPRKKDNIKSVMIKFTMSKPVRLNIK